MTEDVAPACVEHVWEIRAVSLGAGAMTEYECPRCGGEMVVGPGQNHPSTA